MKTTTQATIVFVILFFLILVLLQAIAEAGSLRVYLDTGIAEDSKICFQDAAETPGPPPQPVCQYQHEDITPPGYADTDILVYVKVMVEKVELSDAILILQTLTGAQ